VNVLIKKIPEVNSHITSTSLESKDKSTKGKNPALISSDQ
jgi:hypothetical protein